MACRGCLECLLKLLNFLLTLVGLAMVGYGIYLFVEFKNASSADDSSIAPSSDEWIQLGRPLLMAVSLSSSVLDNLPKAWYASSLSPIFFFLLIVNCILFTHYENMFIVESLFAFKYVWAWLIFIWLNFGLGKVILLAQRLGSSPLHDIWWC